MHSVVNHAHACGICWLLDPTGVLLDVQELKDKNINVTGIYPGYVQTAMTACVLAQNTSVNCQKVAHTENGALAAVSEPDAAGRSASFPSDKMIAPQDIAQAALLPFRMTPNACPTGESRTHHGAN